MNALSLFEDADFAAPVPAPPDDILAFFSKSGAERQRFIESRIAVHGSGAILHLHPKNLPRTKYAPNVLLVAYEDVTKSDVWLRINSIIGPDTLLVLENPSRYPKISSDKVKFLRRLSMRFRGARVLTDIVPFTQSIEYLYTPYSYLGREILGYSHWYAFRENYQEIDDDGRIVHALDNDVLAAKAAPVSEITYEDFCVEDYAMVRFEETEAEQAGYQAKKDALFARFEGVEGLRMADDGPPQKIITRLADFAHAFASRQRALVETAQRLCEEQAGVVVAVFNLQGYASTAAKALKEARLSERCKTTSYQVGAEKFDWSEVGAVIFAEAPIVNSHFRLDIESRIPSGCKVRYLLGDHSGVDKYLNTQIMSELGQIDGFTRALWKACRKRRPLADF